MRDVKPGDVILHLTDNEAFTGFSRALGTCEEMTGPEGTEEAGQPCNLLKLRDFKLLDPPLPRTVIFASPFRERLLALIDAGVKNLFYNKEANLNQGRTSLRYLPNYWQS